MDKINVAKSHLFSIMCTGSSNWCKLGPVEARSFHTKVMRIWRSATASHYVEIEAPELEALTDQQLLQKFELTAPNTMVVLHRINLFIRVVVKGSCDLKRALFAARKSPKSWLKAVHGDFEWLQSLHRDFAEIETLQDWIVQILSRPHWWKVRVKAVCALPKANLLEAEHKIPGCVNLGVVYKCNLCPKKFHTSSGRACHAFTSHGVRSIARPFADASNTCRCCLQRFETRMHLMDHLSRRSPQCLAALVRCCVPLDEEAMQDLDTIDIGVRKLRKLSKKNKLLSVVSAQQSFGPRIDLSDEATLISMCGANA